MKRIRIVWIDDQIESKASGYKAAIEDGPSKGGMKGDIRLVSVEKDFISKIQDLIKPGNRPDLFLIDHHFNPKQALSIKGSSVAHLLRVNFPSVPMVCVTSMLDNKPKTFDQGDLSEYTAIFPYSQLENYIDDLYAIADDFPKLLPTAVHNLREHIPQCLKAPKADAADLFRVLPDEFKTQKHATTEHRIARWIYNELMQRPGFLYDELHAATLLGLSIGGFLKVASVFEKARYRGVFADGSKQHWWCSELRRLLYTNLDAEAPDVPHLAGRKLRGVSERDFSVCYINKKSVPAPDTVASVDSTNNAKLVVVCGEYAVDNPKEYGFYPGFEATKILKKRTKS